MSTARTRLDRARWWAITEQPFYGSLAMNLADVLDASTPTAETNGKVIKWNPDYVESLSDEEIRFLLLHETLHCAHQHLWRLPTDAKGNQAGDYEINLTLTDVDGVSMPEGGLLDEQYRGLACEEILARLGSQDEPPPDQGPGGDGSGDGQDQADGGSGGDDGQGQQQGQGDPCGSFTAPSPDASGGDESVTLRDDWQGHAIQAAQAAQVVGQGDVPGDMQRLLDRLRHQSIDWRREMADFVRDAMSIRNDWSRSARRHAWQSVIYPRRRNDDFATVIFARDTSGSINDVLCAEFSGLISECVSELGCRGLVIDCDSRIQAEYEMSDYEDCPLTAAGGGGTDFRPVFDRADELMGAGEQVAGVVYLTDLLGPAPESSDIPTLWLVTTDRPAPFGRSVKIEN